MFGLQRSVKIKDSKFGVALVLESSVQVGEYIHPDFTKMLVERLTDCCTNNRSFKIGRCRLTDRTQHIHCNKLSIYLVSIYLSIYPMVSLVL